MDLADKFCKSIRDYDYEELVSINRDLHLMLERESNYDLLYDDEEHGTESFLGLLLDAVELLVSRLIIERLAEHEKYKKAMKGRNK